MLCTQAFYVHCTRCCLRLPWRAHALALLPPLPHLPIIQAVIDNSETYTDWTFFPSLEQRFKAPMSSLEHNRVAGLGAATGRVFANILIQSECDFFVGDLTSNRVRLVNELRSTNGRLFSGFVAVSVPN